MIPLVKRRFWDDRHEHHLRETQRGEKARSGLIRRSCDWLRTRVGAWPMESYANFLARRVYLANLPASGELRCLEIGCAPGRNLVQFHRMFGYQAWGVEYSPVGAEETRATFAKAGFDPQCVIESDLFDDEFQREFAGRFHIVLSQGFIEHFDDPRKSLQAHVNLLAPGGHLVCSIPNLRGWSYPFLRLFGKDLLDAHNLSIMRRTPYAALFDGLGLEQVYCDYNGCFGLFGLSLRSERSFRGRVAKLLDLSGDLMNHAMFLVLRGRTIESRWSPSLLYVGRKVQAVAGDERAAPLTH